jgi:hypothetical protein
VEIERNHDVHFEMRLGDRCSSPLDGVCKQQGHPPGHHPTPGLIGVALPHYTRTKAPIDVLEQTRSKTTCSIKRAL